MSKLILQKVITALTIALLLTTSFAGLATAADSLAPLAQQVRSKQVKGTITGGKFAKIWLGLETETLGAQITVNSDWDRENPLQNGVGFFILDDTGLVRAQAGDALNTIALGGGNVVDGAPSTLRASINAVGLAKYTIVVYNDSNTDANFTLTATDAIIVDDSNQVQNPNATTVANTTAVTTTTTTTNTAVVTAVATVAATPAATVATTATTAAPVTAAPVATGPVGVVKAKALSGELPEQNAQHFLGLEPTERDATITLRLSFDPQDSTELARRLNFWVLDQAGFAQFQGGTNASDVAIAAGSRDVDSQINERVAHFKAAGFGPYTVIVYNNSRVPGTYSLTVDGALLVDDSAQTTTAQQAGAAVGSTGTTTATTTSTTTTATTAATPAATAVSSTGTTTTTTATRTGTPGGSYTVKSGDTLALIARDIYGDYKLYEQLCAFNGLTNCNAIEVGQVVKLPTLAQIKTAATAAPAATATKAAATPAATVAPSTATTTTTTAATPAATTVAVATTAAVTTTGTVSGTKPVTTTGTTTATTGTSTGTGTIIDVAVANGAFKTLIAALQATGL
ncbi:MAG: LysM domain-containing protein, partial [Chloroflexi bacterium]|nr:LysM domain-containing protein [Chloroflexota bacterium]